MDKQTDRYNLIDSCLWPRKFFFSSNKRDTATVPRIRLRKPGTKNQGPRNRKPRTRNPEPRTKNQEPGTRSREPGTKNQELRTHSHATGETKNRAPGLSRWRNIFSTTKAIKKRPKRCIRPKQLKKHDRSERAPVRSQLARWEMKSCTPLWCETHLQVENVKARHVRNTFGSWAVEKMHAVVARSTFPSQNVQNTPTKLEVDMSKKCTPLWHEAHFQVNMYKTHRPNWKLTCRKSARRCGAKHISKSKVQKTERVWNTFGRSDVVLPGRRGGLCTWSKVSKTWG